MFVDGADGREAGDGFVRCGFAEDGDSLGERVREGEGVGGGKGHGEEELGIRRR